MYKITVFFSLRGRFRYRGNTYAASACPATGRRSQAAGHWSNVQPYHADEVTLHTRCWSRSGPAPFSQNNLVRWKITHAGVLMGCGAEVFIPTLRPISTDLRPYFVPYRFCRAPTNGAPNKADDAGIDSTAAVGGAAAAGPARGDYYAPLYLSCAGRALTGRRRAAFTAE